MKSSEARTITMRILFVRHAEAVEYSDYAGPDLDRPLTGKGRRTMKLVARSLAQRFDRPARILCSKAERARATAEMISEAFGGLEVEERSELNPGAAPAIWQRMLNEGWKKKEGLLVLVGHEPDLSTVISTLVGEGHLTMKMKKGACADVKLTSPTKGTLRALVDPSWVLG